MDMRSDILPDLQPGYPAGFQLSGCQTDPKSTAELCGFIWPAIVMRTKGGRCHVGSVCLYPSHHRREQGQLLLRHPAGPAPVRLDKLLVRVPSAPSRGGLGPARWRRPGLPGLSTPSSAAPSRGCQGPALAPRWL
jgi:hypothetical protein